MYYDYFGLKQPPFRITPDTNMFFPGGDRGVVLDALIYTIVNGEGIIKVVGEVGSGKTMLCRMLEKELPDNVEVVYIANPSLSPENILHAIAFDLELAVQTSTSRLEVMNKLHEYLLAKHSAGQHVVVFVEEAQSMPIATLEEIRLLSNLETQQSKLLQIILFGQPELDEIMKRREIRQLKERITYSFQLHPFDTDAVRDYLNSRLRACGYRSGEIFNSGATRLIKRYSVGLVRRINILADKSMLAAFAANASNVTAEHVRKAARDSEFVSDWRKKYGLPVLIVTVLAILAVFTGWRIKVAQRSAGRVPVAAVQRANPGPPATPAAVTPGTARLSPGGEGSAAEQEIVNTNKQDMSGNQPAGPAAGPPVANPAGNGSVTVEPSPQPTINNTVPDNPSAAAGPPADATNAEITTHPAADENGKQDTGPGYRILGPVGAPPGAAGNGQYTDQELQILREQLKKLPPAVAYALKPSSDRDACSRCWSIIYRPLSKHENL